jgi:hypothetical protein
MWRANRDMMQFLRKKVAVKRKSLKLLFRIHNGLFLLHCSQICIAFMLGNKMFSIRSEHEVMRRTICDIEVLSNTELARLQNSHHTKKLQMALEAMHL